jgi:tetratricopeptide (TPR) repeat protein
VVWLIFGLVVLALLGAIVLWAPGRGGSPKPGPAPSAPPTSAEIEAINAELAELGDLFGQAMDNDRDMRPVLDRIDRFIADHPDTAGAYTLRGQVLAYAGRTEAALESLQQSLKLQPRQADVQVLAGTAAMGLQRYEEARKHYETALSIEPDNGKYAVYLANVQQRLGQDDEAVTTLLIALRRDSKLHSAYALLSDIYAKQNKVSMALDQIDRTLEATPVTDAGMRTAYTLKRAALLRRDNKPAEALATLEALPADARLRAEVLRDTATCWAMLGKPAMAAEMYERVLTADPSNDTAAAEAAQWWLKADNPEAALNNLNALRRINPRHPAISDLESKLRTPESTPAP